ncbi:MAG: ATP-dependent helicase [Proteobacteria bacterium]|nr:ATP-dependent helicase [Pseudomonadota bacterium]
MNFAVGSLVHARGREWVVLPQSDPQCLMLRPLGGCEDETVGILPSLEEIRPATFELPEPTDLGDARTCGLLRDAVRLGFRATSGPFRSFGHIAVEPRPYQLVPLLMAMKQSPVRLLIADDVGIGKTVEAALIARELLDRGEVKRLAVLCPPQLAEQWQGELADKFHIQAELVLPSTVRKLERGLGVGTSLFDVYPFTIVSLDYIKSDRRRAEFLRTCPEMVIVDEAHSCASSSGGRATKQRFDLINDLANNPDRHMLFVSATPHSGKDDVFRSLLCFLRPSFANLPEDFSGKENEEHRKALAEHFVQRRRGDIRAYMDTQTPFPERETQEITWKLTPDAKSLFGRIIALARESIDRSQGKSTFQQRIHWWSALALLRAVASSPAAAAATLRSRATGLDNPDDLPLVDELGRQSVFDLTDMEGMDALDTIPGADTADMETDSSEQDRFRRRLRDLAKSAEALFGAEDSKLQGMISLAKKLLSEGYAPIVFCRFIHTAEYLAEHLRTALRGVEVMAVTGMLPPSEREFRVQELGKHPKRLLVCTDCLSEGINLQDRFNAVVHYDLSWNPTRHEQREGRVDRFGQPCPTIRVITYYGLDNQIDGIVLDVLLRKHEAIRKALGVSVPIPEDSDKVMHAILEGLLLRGREQGPAQQQLILPGFEKFIKPEADRLAQEWDNVAKREEKRSRTLFAQQSIKVDDVARELEAANAAAGDCASVEQFTTEALKLLGAVHVRKSVFNDRVAHDFSFSGVETRTKNRLDLPENLQAVFALPTGEGQTYLARTHPFVEALATHVMSTALDPLEKSVARRAGAMRTRNVPIRTTLLLCRFRFQLKTQGQGIEHTCLTEECALLAYTGAPERAIWLEDDAAQTLLAAEPDQNILPDQAAGFVAKVTAGADHLLPHIRTVMTDRASALLDAHRRVRTAAKARGIRYQVTPQGEPDILGVYVYLPIFEH